MTGETYTSMGPRYSLHQAAGGWVIYDSVRRESFPTSNNYRSALKILKKMNTSGCQQGNGQ